jgi:HEAT repeat protein
MMTFKRFFMLAFAALFAISVAVGQSGNSGQQISDEEAYLQEQVDLMIIRDSSRMDSLDKKLIALEYIGRALERGSTSEEIRIALERLAFESTINQSRDRGLLLNDFPMVRREAAKYLGILGTPEAKSALVRICMNENEPLVLQEAVKSLGLMDIKDDDEAVIVIVWLANKYNNTNAPDNLLALAAINSLDKIAERNKGIQNVDVHQILAKIAEGPYVPQVKQRARDALVDLRKYMAQGIREQREQQAQAQ